MQARQGAAISKMTYLGIDGGGSKTTFLVVDDEDQEICRVQAGPSNWLSVGREAAAAAIHDGVAQLKGPTPDVVCGGFAGAGRQEGSEFYRGVLERLLPKSRVRVESDGVIAYAGAIGLKPGVLLIAGTGSIAIGRKSGGSMIRVGGWGPHFGDEGSGFWIGREAVRVALRSLDSDEDSSFARRIASALGVTSVKDVVARWASGTLSVPGIAALFPEIIAMWPDEPAASILRAAAAHLKLITETAVQRVGVSPYPLSISGSVATSPIIRHLIGFTFDGAKAPPEKGAILLARAT